MLAAGSIEATAAAKKAWETRRKNYNAPEKNEFRSEVVRFFINEGRTLALESEQLLFAKAMPKAELYIFERDKEVYEKILCNKSKNVIAVFNSDVTTARSFSTVKYDQGFFDFCNSFDSNVERIKMLRPIINKMKRVAFTFSQRGTKKITTKDREYAVYINNELIKLLPEFEVRTCKVYNDTSTMVGIILRHKPKIKSKLKEVDVKNNTTGKRTIHKHYKEVGVLCKHCNKVFTYSGYSKSNASCPHCKKSTPVTKSYYASVENTFKSKTPNVDIKNNKGIVLVCKHCGNTFNYTGTSTTTVWCKKCKKGFLVNRTLTKAMQQHTDIVVNEYAPESMNLYETCVQLNGIIVKLKEENKRNMQAFTDAVIALAKRDGI